MMTVLTPVNAPILNEARSVAACGREVILLAAAEGSGSVPQAGPEGVAIRRIALRTRSLPKIPAAWALKYAEALLRLVWAGGRVRADLYEAHDVDALLPAWIVARLKRRKLILNAHELWTERSMVPARSLWKWLEQRLIPRADAIFCPDENRADIMLQEYGARARPVVVANAGAFHPVQRTDRLGRFLAGQGLPGGRIVLYQGGLLPGRCCEELIQAFAHVNTPAALVLMGGGAGPYVDTLRALASRLRLDGKVFFHPPVPLDEVMSYTASADVGVALYRNTGRNNYLCAPTKLSEYWMAGLPVIVSDFPGMRRLVGNNGVGLLVDPESPTGIAQAVDRLLSDPALFRHMSEKAVWFVENEYNWQIESRKLLAVYDSLLDRHAPETRGRAARR